MLLITFSFMVISSESIIFSFFFINTNSSSFLSVKRRCVFASCSNTISERSWKSLCNWLKYFYFILVPDALNRLSDSLLYVSIIAVFKELIQHTKITNYPNTPVRYSSVFLFRGLVNMWRVLPYSIKSPRYINMELSEIRAACDML